MQALVMRDARGHVIFTAETTQGSYRGEKQYRTHSYHSDFCQDESGTLLCAACVWLNNRSAVPSGDLAPRLIDYCRRKTWARHLVGIVAGQAALDLRPALELEVQH